MGPNLGSHTRLRENQLLNPLTPKMPGHRPYAVSIPCVFTMAAVALMGNYLAVA